MPHNETLPTVASRIGYSGSLWGLLTLCSEASLVLTSQCIDGDDVCHMGWGTGDDTSEAHPKKDTSQELCTGSLYMLFAIGKNSE